MTNKKTSIEQMPFEPRFEKFAEELKKLSSKYYIALKERAFLKDDGTIGAEIKAYDLLDNKNKI
jgi:hypothetical protein